MQELLHTKGDNPLIFTNFTNLIIQYSDLTVIFKIHLKFHKFMS